jgi:hypothetical protein
MTAIVAKMAGSLSQKQESTAGEFMNGPQVLLARVGSDEFGHFGGSRHIVRGSGFGFGPRQPFNVSYRRRVYNSWRGIGNTALGRIQPRFQGVGAFALLRAYRPLRA